MDSYESLIAKAILGDDNDKADAMRQTTCKLSASTKMFCECGHILDQKTIHVLEQITIETNEEKTLASCCPDCAKRHSIAVATIARVQAGTFRFVWQTWKKTIQIEG